MATRYDFDINSLWKQVDDINYNYIDPPTLKRFLIKTGFHVNEAKLIAIIRRFDLDADAKLNKKEFEEGIKPIKEFSKRAIKEANLLSKSMLQKSSSKKSQRSTSRSGLKSSRSKSRILSS